MISIELSRDGWTQRLQLSIQHYAEDGSGDGYRLWGPKFNGSSTVVHKHVLDERDAAEIRAYLDREFPVPGALPVPSEESQQAAAEILGDIVAEIRAGRGVS